MSLESRNCEIIKMENQEENVDILNPTKIKKCQCGLEEKKQKKQIYWNFCLNNFKFVLFIVVSFLFLLYSFSVFVISVHRGESIEGKFQHFLDLYINITKYFPAYALPLQNVQETTSLP